ncbi:tyrosine-type recombinase/integrase [Crocinitomix algicola]|uniref:tyrosine-type recombinase/integrase n=1 Tax=Crocinitomix algicola TaxID=1740263 RepID=UPI0008724D1E|nr:tyrosine-type recombinase/integrase [Crocinitomix algicola]
MSVKGSKTACSGLDWNVMLGLLAQLKKDKKWQDYLLICIGSYLGLRASDLLNLKWDDILGKSTLELKEGKTGKSRSIRINPNCLNAVEFVWNHQPKKHFHTIDHFIFVNRRGKKISLQYINRRLKTIFEEYKVKTDNPSTHTLRKTFGRRVYEMDDQSERSLIMLSMIFSHSNIAITKRYLGITQEEIQDVYLSL